MEPERIERITRKTCKSFAGDFHDLERAIGMLHVGNDFGWKVLYLTHDPRTIRKYEELLGINVRDDFPERGALAHKSVALTLADDVSNFWKAVKGEITGVRTPEIQ